MLLHNAGCLESSLNVLETSEAALSVSLSKYWKICRRIDLGTVVWQISIGSLEQVTTLTAGFDLVSEVSGVSMDMSVSDSPV